MPRVSRGQFGRSQAMAVTGRRADPERGSSTPTSGTEHSNRTRRKLSKNPDPGQLRHTSPQVRCGCWGSIMVVSTHFLAEQASGGETARGPADCGLCPPLRGRGRVRSVAVWRGRLGRSLLVVVAVAAATFAVGGVADAQVASGEVRIVARRVDDGRVEFGLQERAGAESWGSRLSPSKRFFPVDVAVDKWLVSSPVSVSGGVVRIVARRVDDGRVEFGLQERAGAESWGSRLSPSKRFFPVDVAVDKWLVSSPVSVGGVATTGGSGAVACAGVRPPEFIDEVIREAVCLPDIPGRVRFFRTGGSGDVEANPDFFRHPHPNIMQTRLLLSTPLRLEVGTVFEMHHYVAPESRTPRVYLRGVDANGRRTRLQGHEGRWTVAQAQHAVHAVPPVLLPDGDHYRVVRQLRATVGAGRLLYVGGVLAGVARRGGRNVPRLPQHCARDAFELLTASSPQAGGVPRVSRGQLACSRGGCGGRTVR